MTTRVSKVIHLLLSNFCHDSPLLPALLSLDSASTSTKVTVSAILVEAVFTLLASASAKNRFFTSGPPKTVSASRLASCLVSLVSVLRRLCRLTSASAEPWDSPEVLGLLPENKG